MLIRQTREQTTPARQEPIAQSPVDHPARPHRQALPERNSRKVTWIRVVLAPRKAGQAARGLISWTVPALVLTCLEPAGYADARRHDGLFVFRLDSPWNRLSSTRSAHPPRWSAFVGRTATPHRAIQTPHVSV